MRVLTNGQMKLAEAYAMEELGVSSEILMENAALSVVHYIERKFDITDPVAVFCGKGNNGGDGFAIARGLFSRGYDVGIFVCGDMERASADCTANFKRAKAIGIPFYEEPFKLIEKSSIIIDALIGTGLRSEPREDVKRLCRAINAYDKTVIAVDCPTGVNSDTGEAYEDAVKADITYTFHLPKTGLLLLPGRSLAGKLKTGSIGIPAIAPEEGLCINTLTEKEAALMLPKRFGASNKGSYGRVYAFSGSDGMTGAAVFNLTAAYLSGAGLVYGVCTEKCADIIHRKLAEAVTLIVPDEGGFLTEEAWDRAAVRFNSVILAGSGLGVKGCTKALVKRLVRETKTSLILDADALNCLGESKDILKKAEGDVVITPHIGEMSRLTGLSAEEIKADPIAAAYDFAREYNVTTALKDAVTVIASPKGKIYINTTGTAAMSKGGTGDVLAGLTAGLCAQGLCGFDAAVLGTYINGLAGERAERKKGAYSVLASDICNSIPKTLKKLGTMRPKA